MVLFERGRETIDANRLPAATRDYLRVAANRIGSANFKKHAGMSLKVAHKTLCSLSDRLVLNPDDTWRMPSDWTQGEFAALKCVLSLLVGKPAFEPELLTQGFFDTLKSCGLLTKEEVRQHGPTLSPLIQLFAVSVMHRTKVIMEDGASLPIYARANVEQKQIELLCHVTVPFRGKSISMASPIFIAKLDPLEHCHPDLLDSDGEIQSELELSAERKLVSL
jgi:hypothetical protein